MHPTKIGEYIIEKKIGAGGMGNVYLGRHSGTGQVAAIKVLPSSLAREEGFVRRFDREVQALQKVSDRHIVRLFESGTFGETVYYAMEYVDGRTLTAIIAEQKRIPWNEVIDVAIQIGRALKAAHDAGVIHRDLKPSNLMITHDGQLKLTDFGVAHVFATTRLTRTGGIVGTAEYMAPEQARGHRATKRSDLYSLGAVMYVMLTGRPPFTGKTHHEILHRLQFTNFDRPSRYVSDLPRLLEEFVCGLLEKNPDDRIPDAIVLIRQLEQMKAQLHYADNHAATRTIMPEESEDGERTDNGFLLSDSHATNRGPGPATLVRDFLRSEAEKATYQSPVARFFNNTWVLLGLLTLIVVGGFYFARSDDPDPAEQYAEAERILKLEPGPAWLRARENLLQPLSELDEWSAKVVPLIRKVDQYDFCRRLQSRLPVSNIDEDSELQRLIEDVFVLQSRGERFAAREQLQDILRMIDGDPQYAYYITFLQRVLAEWGEDSFSDGQRSLIESRLDRAESFLESDPARAEALIRVVLDVYAAEAMDDELRARAATLSEAAGRNLQKAEREAGVP